MKSHLLPFLFVSFYRLLTRGGKVLIEDTACPRNESPSLATQGARERERGKVERERATHLSAEMLHVIHCVFVFVVRYPCLIFVFVNCCYLMRFFRVSCFL